MKDNTLIVGSTGGCACHDLALYREKWKQQQRTMNRAQHELIQAHPRDLQLHFDLSALQIVKEILFSSTSFFAARLLRRVRIRNRSKLSGNSTTTPTRFTTKQNRGERQLDSGFLFAGVFPEIQRDPFNAVLGLTFAVPLPCPGFLLAPESLVTKRCAHHS